MDETYPPPEQEPPKGYAAVVAEAEGLSMVDTLQGNLNQWLETPIDEDERDPAPLDVVDERGQPAGMAVCTIHVGDGHKVMPDFNTAGAIEEAAESYVVVRKSSGELWFQQLSPEAMARSSVQLTYQGISLPPHQEVRFRSPAGEWLVTNTGGHLRTRAVPTHHGYWILSVVGAKKGSKPRPVAFL